MDDKRTEKIIEEMVNDYNAIFKGVAFVKDEYARTRAANGLMVELCKLKDYVKTSMQKFPELFEEGTKQPAARPKEVAPAKEEVPKAPAEPGQQKLAETPENIPSPGTKATARAEPFATEKQVNAIKKFCETPKLKGVVAETLRKTGKPNVGQLSIAEASDLVGRLIDLSSGRIPPGAKVDTGVKA